MGSKIAVSVRSLVTVNVKLASVLICVPASVHSRKRKPSLATAVTVAVAPSSYCPLPLTVPPSVGLTLMLIE